MLTSTMQQVGEGGHCPSDCSAAFTVSLAATVFQAGPGSTLFRSRCEERRPLLFNLRTAALGTLDLALFMFGKG
jgi:hypothetical protein